MSDALIAAIAVILAALLAAFLSYMHARRLQRSQARLERLNAQLEELYGPLYATLEASRIAYSRFLERLRPGSSSLFFDLASRPASNEELRLFRQWIETVSHPRATRAYELIISKAHLLIEDEMPACLLQFARTRLVTTWLSRGGSTRISPSISRWSGTLVRISTVTSGSPSPG